LDSDNKSLLDFAQKWLSGTIEPNDLAILNSWYYSLEGVPLGCPDEFTVEQVEKRLHEMFFKRTLDNMHEELLPPWNSLGYK